MVLRRSAYKTAHHYKVITKKLFCMMRSDITFVSIQQIKTKIRPHHARHDL